MLFIRALSWNKLFKDIHWSDIIHLKTKMEFVIERGFVI